VEIVYVPVLNSKIVNDKTEGNLRRDMAKERGGGCLVVPVLGEMGHELLISMKPGLGKAGDSIDNFSIEKRFTGIITLDKRRNAEVVQKFGPVIRSIHLEEFRERHRTTEIEVRDIDDTEERILRYRSVHDAFNCREVSGGGGNRVLDLDAVTAAGTAYTPDDRVVFPLFARYLVIICSLFGGAKTRFKATCSPDELEKLSAAEVKPNIPIRTREASFPRQGSAKMIET
jgi:hypothetical protein